MVGVGKRTAVTSPKPAYASSSRHIRISTPRISREQKKKRQDHDLTGGSKGSHHEPLVLSKGLQPLTPHRFSIRHNDPSRPGIVNEYDLNSAVYTTCANRISWSGVRAVSGMFRIARKFCTAASYNGDTAKGLYRMSSEPHPASVVYPLDTDTVHRWTA